MAFPNAERPAAAVSANGPQEVGHAGQREHLRDNETHAQKQGPGGNGLLDGAAPAISDKQQLIALSCIKDGGAQMRVEKTSPDIINEYAEAMLNGDVFPPVILYFDGTDYWLGEGYHRVEATRKIECNSILADVRQGTARDAILCGIGSNATHGLRRTQADKRCAVEKLLTDPEWARWSDRKIAEAAKVDHKTVGKIRREMGGEIPTGKSMGGDFPKPNGKPSGSIFDDVLRSISDDALIAECRRRGLEVAHA